MASNSSYTLLLQGKIDTKSLDADIKAYSSKSLLVLKASLNKTDVSKIESELERIKNLGGELGKISIFKGDDGKLTKAVINYRDSIGSAVRETLKFNDGIKTLETTTQNYDKELTRVALNAEKFLARAENLAKTPTVNNAVNIAKDLQSAVQEGDIAKVRKLNDELAIAKARLTTGRTALDSWKEGLKNAIKQTIEYATSIGLVYGALRKIGDGIQYVKDLNKEMTNIQVLGIEGARNADQIAGLADKYNALAKEMGATTLEVAQGSVEWLRQGKTIEETGTLLRSTLMASKLGNMETAQATEYLTSILNGFQMQAEDATSVVDKMIAVDNVSATSFAELATAMQYSSAIANQTGVSFDKLVAMIATVSSVTRLAPEMIGNAYKTMFTRMEQVKAGAIDETGMSLNNVEKTLTSVGISLRDATDSFRPLENVLDDVAGKWDTLSEVQQAQIANAVAGVRQSQIFLSLMQNYGDVTKYVTEESKSAGLAQERYAMYLDNVEAAQNRLRASWEKLWQQTISSGMITYFLDLGSAILDFISSAGGLQPILMAVLGVIIMIKREAFADLFIKLGRSITQNIIPAIKNVVMGMMGLQTEAVATGVAVNTAFGVLGLVITAISLAVMAFNAHAEEASRAVQKLSGEISQLHTEQTKLNQDVVQLRELGAQWEELAGIQDKSTEQQKQWIDINNKLHSILPQVNGDYDEQGNFILTNSTNLKELLDLKKEEIRLNNAQLAQKNKEQLQASVDVYQQQRKELERLTNKYQQWLKVRELSNDQETEMSKKAKQQAIDEIDAQKLLVDDTVNQMKQAFFSLDEEQQKIQLEMLRNSGDFGRELADQIKPITNDVLSAEERTLQKLEKLTQDTVGLQKKEYLDLIDTVKKLSGTYDTLGEAIKKSREGSLQTGDLEKLAGVYPDYLKALSIEQGQLKLNSTLLRKYAQEQTDSAIETAKANGATQEQIDILKAQGIAFQNSMSFSKDYVDNLSGIMAGVADSLTGKAKDSFTQLATSVNRTNEEFRQGQIDTEEYFNVLNQQLSSVDFAETFQKNENAAQSFFAGMVENTAGALYQMTSEFDAGEIGLVEYMGRMQQLGDIFQTINNVVQTSGETLGLTTQQIEGIGSASDGVVSSLAELSSMYDLVNYSIAGMSQNLEFGSEAYNNWAQTVANAMASVGGSWTDAAGNVLSSSDAIYNYATASAGNMSVLVGQVSDRINGIIARATSSVADFLRQLGNSISSFKGSIDFKPRLVGGTTQMVGIPGIAEFPLTLPALTLDIGANFGGISDFVSGIANSIESWGANSPVNLSDFINPAGTGATSSASDAISGGGGGGGGGGGSSSPAQHQIDAQKELQQAIEDTRKAAIQSLKDQLKAYKDLIDRRKKLLDSLQQEHDYQNQIDDKNKQILDVQNELASLQFDTSEEAQARKLELQDQLNQLQSDLADMQYSHSIDEQKNALDEDYQAFEDTINNAIKDIQGINATSLEDFASQLAVIMQGVAKAPASQAVTSSSLSHASPVPTFHDGKVGDGLSLNSNEMFAKILRGETIIPSAQAERFARSLSPAMGDTSASAPNITIDMPINVAGNLDKTVIPDLERITDKVVDKINDSMLKRGYNRRADLFGL